MFFLPLKALGNSKSMHIGFLEFTSDWRKQLWLLMIQLLVERNRHDCSNAGKGVVSREFSAIYQGLYGQGMSGKVSFSLRSGSGRETFYDQ